MSSPRAVPDVVVDPVEDLVASTSNIEISPHSDAAPRLTSSDPVIHKSTRKYGWVRPTAEPAEPHHFFAIRSPRNRQTVADVARHLPPFTFDQSQIGSCTGNGWSATVMAARHKMGLPFFTPSRLFIYYGEREMENTIMDDAGANIGDGARFLHRFGYCPEDQPTHPYNWPYDISKFTDRPRHECYDFAKNHISLLYHRVQQHIEQFKACLEADYPFVGGIDIYESFESDQTAKTGVVSMPRPGEQCLGGHCIIFTKFDTEYRFPDGRKGAFWFRNSWGEGWGCKDSQGVGGHEIIPFDYLCDPKLASDFWTITMVRESTS